MSTGVKTAFSEESCALKIEDFSSFRVVFSEDSDALKIDDSGAETEVERRRRVATQERAEAIKRTKQRYRGNVGVIRRY